MSQKLGRGPAPAPGQEISRAGREGACAVCWAELLAGVADRYGDTFGAFTDLAMTAWPK